MSRLKVPYGTTAQLTTNLVQEREVAYDTTLDRLVYGDGVAAAGVPLAKKSEIDTLPATTVVTATGSTTARTLADYLADAVNLKGYALGNAVKGSTGVATSGDATFTDAGASWISSDVGKSIRVNGAGAAGADLTTTIASINSPTSIELTIAPSTTVASNCAYVYGTNDTTGVQTWIDVCRTTGKVGFAPAGLYLCDALTCGPRVQNLTPCFYGAGANTTRFIKLTNNSSPLLTINSEGATTYFTGATFEGMAFEARPLGPGVRHYSLVRCVFRDIEATTGLIGVEQFGGIGVAYDSPGFHANGTGLKIRKYTASIGTGYPNLTSIHQGYLTENTALGLDFDDGKSVHIYGTNIEGNGTAATSNNGNIYVGTAIGSEDSVEAYGVIMFGGWLESGSGDAAVICRSGVNVFVGVDVAANAATYDFDMRGGRYVLRDITGPTAKTTSVNEGASVGTPNWIENVKLGGAISVDGAKTFVFAPNSVNMRLPGLLQFGGVSASFPALKRNGSTSWLVARLADDSGDTNIRGLLTTSASATTGLSAGAFAATTDATIVLYDATGQAYRVPCKI